MKRLLALIAEGGVASVDGKDSAAAYWSVWLTALLSAYNQSLLRSPRLQSIAKGFFEVGAAQRLTLSKAHALYRVLALGDNHKSALGERTFVFIQKNIQRDADEVKRLVRKVWSVNANFASGRVDPSKTGGDDGSLLGFLWRQVAGGDDDEAGVAEATDSTAPAVYMTQRVNPDPLAAVKSPQFQAMWNGWVPNAQESDRTRAQQQAQQLQLFARTRVKTPAEQTIPRQLFEMGKAGVAAAYELLSDAAAAIGIIEDAAHPAAAGDGPAAKPARAVKPNVSTVDCSVDPFKAIWTTPGGPGFILTFCRFERQHLTAVNATSTTDFSNPTVATTTFLRLLITVTYMYGSAMDHLPNTMRVLQMLTQTERGQVYDEFGRRDGFGVSDAYQQDLRDDLTGEFNWSSISPVHVFKSQIAQAVNAGSDPNSLMQSLAKLTVEMESYARLTTLVGVLWRHLKCATGCTRDQDLRAGLISAAMVASASGSLQGIDVNTSLDSMKTIALHPLYDPQGLVFDSLLSPFDLILNLQRMDQTTLTGADGRTYSQREKLHTFCKPLIEAVYKLRRA